MSDITTKAMIDDYSNQPRALTQEERLRRENPGLQELYDQYQTMLKLLTPAKPKTPQTPQSPSLLLPN